MERHTHTHTTNWEPITGSLHNHNRAMWSTKTGSTWSQVLMTCMIFIYQLPFCSGPDNQGSPRGEQGRAGGQGRWMIQRNRRCWRYLFCFFLLFTNQTWTEQITLSSLVASDRSRGAWAISIYGHISWNRKPCPTTCLCTSLSEAPAWS